MRSPITLLAVALVLSMMQPLSAENTVSPPKTVYAGDAFSIQTTGNGRAVLYIVGPGQVLRRDVQLGQTTFFPARTLTNAGHYLAVLEGVPSTEGKAFDVTPAKQPMNLSFLAKPSRLPVGLHDGISGTVYVFDAYENLITAPAPVSFQLSSGSGTVQSRTIETLNGVAWTQMDSEAKEGSAKFVARVGEISSTRVIQEVPGDPCGLKMSARQSGDKLEVETNSMRDCAGNIVPDGTIVTFTELYNGAQSTVDVPIKHGVAKAEMPAYKGARISAATGVVLGNEIYWGKQ